LGIDLHEFIRGDRPWDQMYRFLARLPRHSHFHASVMDDDESVEQLLDRPASRAFGLAGWTFERELLTAMVDALNQVHATLIQINSQNGQRPAVDPLPRPVTALHRQQARQRFSAHQSRVRLVQPSEP
jgi:hypothetical protein